MPDIVVVGHPDNAEAVKQRAKELGVRYVLREDLTTTPISQQSIYEFSAEDVDKIGQPI